MVGKGHKVSKASKSKRQGCRDGLTRTSGGSVARPPLRKRSVKFDAKGAHQNSMLPTRGKTYFNKTIRQDWAVDALNEAFRLCCIGADFSQLAGLVVAKRK